MIKADVNLTSKIEDDNLTICLCGEIDHHTAISLRQNSDELIFRYRPHELIFDLSKIEFMDSSGLGLIMGRYSLMKKFDGSVTIINPSERVEKILSIAGLEKIIKIERTKEK